jgi:hypothetical protein
MLDRKTTRVGKDEVDISFHTLKTANFHPLNGFENLEWRAAQWTLRIDRTRCRDIVRQRILLARPNGADPSGIYGIGRRRWRV